MTRSRTAIGMSSTSVDDAAERVREGAVGRRLRQRAAIGQARGDDVAEQRRRLDVDDELAHGRRVDVGAARVVADEDRLLHDEEDAAPHEQRNVVEHGGGDLVAVGGRAQARQRRIGHRDLREAGQRVRALALGAAAAFGLVSRIGSLGSAGRYVAAGSRRAAAPASAAAWRRSA